MPIAMFSRNGNFIGLLLANTILGFAMPMLLILGGLTGLLLAPNTALVTLPASVQTLAGLLAAAPFSVLMGRFGRRAGFAGGGILALIGAGIGAVALITGSFALLCLGHFILGAALSSFQYFRFAAAEVVSPDWQPVAISLMLTSGLVAAIGGPQIFIMAKDALAPIPLAGAYLALIAVICVGLGPLALVRIPKPPVAKTGPRARRFASFAVLRRGPVRRAVAIAAISQGVMIFMMIPTPVAMLGCGFSETVAGDVIRWHVVAMFAPSFVTGFLIKWLGTERIAMSGLVILGIAALAAVAGLSSAHFYGSLILLGVGWNFSFIGATNLLATAVTDTEKSAVQGVNDTIIALVSTVCAFAAGLVVTGLGWAVVVLASIGIIGLALCALLVRRAAPAPV
ncbi:MFS transporter [Roseobacter sp. N2S]|uniref:MFS transporter n=1 Tax=Roseobacter sp. N2S TaxID=2663844 RepID=UPI00285E5419|nr:MFS transporter [Roseobacter sp. N2S]MDR6266868.1 putative MFS family arabinose efflux permease [Roseobacter sp. N2S]